MTQRVDATNTLPDGFNPEGERWHHLWAPQDGGSGGHDYDTYVPESEYGPDTYSAPGYYEHPFTTHTVYPHDDVSGTGPESRGNVRFDHEEMVSADEVPADLSDPDAYWGDVE